jgi:hypothetical protein
MSGCWQNSGSMSNEFSFTRILQNHASAWQFEAAWSLTTWGSITKFGWTVLTCSAYSPSPAPSGFHLFGFLENTMYGTEFETDDMIRALRTWLCVQGRAWYWQGTHTHICSLLAQGCRSEWRLCEKMWYGIKQSLFMMCNFWSRNKCLLKKPRGITFWATVVLL